MQLFKNTLTRSGFFFDALHLYWESKDNQRIIASILVVAFLASLAVVKLGHIYPNWFFTTVPTNIFYPIELVFSLLLVVEIVSLILSLSHSVAVSMGKQFEILALILLRNTFKDFSHLEQPLSWHEIYSGVIGEMALDAFGALFIFIGLLFLYRIQRHQTITRDNQDQVRFILVKKLLALLLLAAFILLGSAYLSSKFGLMDSFRFFEEFYTVLIFSDILIVLISLRYSYSFLVVFRNSGFAVATLVIRLGLSSPTPFHVLFGSVALLFVIILSLAYNHFYELK